ncbi:IPT/TIG domain-containing protein [Paradesertivirga mongoliensis]|uniref:IPT/TIG domain-containing protein n=1 Tax=Paradesertivirga mongoliensis TaxID=2100740 RepID=A0ABW4ZM28_9SPHI|nr:IPT/TIG domain-containing protein [Pedobacter mongoliensis]
MKQKKLSKFGGFLERKPRGGTLHLTVALLVFAFTAVMLGCKENGETPLTGVAHNPAIPVEVNTFMPDSGGIRTKFVIKGSNFGNDKSKVSVFFKDNETERKAVIIGINNETIYCLAPRQNGGSNIVRVEVDGKAASTAKTFKYLVAENVSHIVGVRGEGRATDGSLAEGRINRTFGIAALGNDELLTFESLVNTVRFISVPSNKIITIQTSFDGTQPAITKDRSKVYSIGRSFPHRVYVYEKNTLWAPKIVAAQIASAPGIIMSACLDNEEQWLYFRERGGAFGRMEIANPTNVEIIKAVTPGANSGDYNYMSYSPIEDCFYYTVQGQHSVYKMSKAGDVELYAGNGLGRSDGFRTDAQFNQGSGILVDLDGNIWIADSSNHTIRKINKNSGFVSTVAGIPGVQGASSGIPALSTFDYPYAFAVDENNAMFIGESWGCTLRKLAIE